MPLTEREGRGALNFSGGPGALPELVLEQAARAVRELPGTGVSILGLHHRSADFHAIVEETEGHLRALLSLPPDYRVLFLQGGGTQQFSMVPIHLLRGSRTAADYVVSGYWSQNAAAAATLEGPVRILWSGEADGFARMPRQRELPCAPEAAYLHYVSNETVEGIQAQEVLGLPGVPRVCDASSDFLSAPLDVAPFDVLYAHAQKNLGPAGVTVVLVHQRVLDRPPPGVPPFLLYKTHADARSIYNTPPVFAIYVTLLVLRWLRQEVGGLVAMGELNRRKAALVYEALDSDEGRFFVPRAERASRSRMNVTFQLRDRALEPVLLAEAEARGFVGLAGHRTIGGLRISLYNGVTLEATQTLCGFLAEFRARHGGPS
jgi:phosphoserine aminotransferase